jgi:hypothetical protein
MEMALDFRFTALNRLAEHEQLVATLQSIK